MRGADLRATERQYGFTPMQTAIFNGHYDLAARLVEKGADVNDGRCTPPSRCAIWRPTATGRTRRTPIST